MRRRNVTGRRIAFLRSEKGMSQDMLAARLTCKGFSVTREKLSNMENGRTLIRDRDLPYFQKALGVPLVMLYSQEVQEDEKKYAQQYADWLKRRSRHAKS
jgi:transcriptional regulator with XRE-family HTH domain